MKQESAEYVLSLADNRAVLETVGGKGASLARLVAAGLPVPDGFHVTTAAYRAFVDSNDLQSGILAALETVEGAEPATLEAASQAIAKLFDGAQTPPEVASDIALASPTMYGTFSVPARRPSSWCPPSMNGLHGVPRRTYSAPMPLGACTLWPENDSRSTFRCSPSRSMGILVTD